MRLKQKKATDRDKLQYLYQNARTNAEKVLYRLMLSEVVMSDDVEGLDRRQFRTAVKRLRKDYTILNIAPHTYKILWQ